MRIEDLADDSDAEQLVPVGERDRVADRRSGLREKAGRDKHLVGPRVPVAADEVVARPGCCATERRDPNLVGKSRNAHGVVCLSDDVECRRLGVNRGKNLTLCSRGRNLRLRRGAALA